MLCYGFTNGILQFQWMTQLVALWKQETNFGVLQASGHEHDWSRLLNIESGLTALINSTLNRAIHLTTTGTSLEMDSQ